MVFICHDDLGWMPYVKTWAEQRIVTSSKEEAIQQKKIYMNETCLIGLLNMFNNTFEKAKNFTRTFYEPFPTIPIQKASNICNIL